MNHDAYINILVNMDTELFISLFVCDWIDSFLLSRYFKITFLSSLIIIDLHDSLFYNRFISLYSLILESGWAVEKESCPITLNVSVVHVLGSLLCLQLSITLTDQTLPSQDVRHPISLSPFMGTCVYLRRTARRNIRSVKWPVLGWKATSGGRVQ